MANEMNAEECLESLVAGDMITFISIEKVKHWGIYIGDKKVIHLTGETTTEKGNQSEVFSVAGEKYTKATAKMEDFLDIAKAFNKYEINCITSKRTPDKPKDIVELAKTMVGHIYYNEKWNSCEQLAIYCRYKLLPNSHSLGKSVFIIAIVEGDHLMCPNMVHASLMLFAGIWKRNGDAIVKGAYLVMCQEVSSAGSSLDIPDDDEMGQNYIKKYDEWFMKEHAKEGVLSKEHDFIKENNIKAILMLDKGDLVTIKRAWYYHWAVYIGNYRIIHLSGNEPITRNVKIKHIFSISGVPFAKGSIREDDLMEVLKDSKLDINNGKDELFKKKKPEEIVKTAKRMLGKIGYNIIWNNCEHFASECRYDVKRSDQVISGVWYSVGICAFAYLAIKLTPKIYTIITGQNMMFEIATGLRIAYGRIILSTQTPWVSVILWPRPMPCFLICHECCLIKT